MYNKINNYFPSLTRKVGCFHSMPGITGWGHDIYDLLNKYLLNSIYY